MSRGHFDLDAFHAALDAQRRGRRLTWKAVASQAGVSASTLTRMAQGRRPDVDGLAALASWAGLEPGDFIRNDGRRQNGRQEPLAAISTFLSSDPNLTPEGARAIDELVKATYERFRRD
jgi:transcriptional regulator with XRE-family HTH domain